MVKKQGGESENKKGIDEGEREKNK